MILSTNLRKLRTKQDKSQQEIADLLNVDRRTYVNWENGIPMLNQITFLN